MTEDSSRPLQRAAAGDVVRGRPESRVARGVPAPAGPERDEEEGAGAGSGGDRARTASPAAARPPCALPCAHCGLPVPPGLESPGGASFCCSGCATAWAVLHQGGLEQYYAMAERRLAPVRASGRGFEELDHPSFHQLYVRRETSGWLATDLYLEGVHCGSCVWLVERAPLLVGGMVQAELDVRRSVVRVRWDESATTLSTIARTLDTLGYRPHPFRGGKAERLRRAEDRAMLVRIGVAGALAANTMLAALALYSGWFSGMEAEYQRTFRWLSLLLATPAVFGPGLVFFRGALAALRTRTLNMDLPIALALAAGYTRGAVNTVTDQGPIYFDGVAMLVFLLLVGRFLQQRAQRAANDSAELLHSLTPASARVVEGAVYREVPAEALVPDLVIEVRAGENVAADGVVIEGDSELDLSLLTGESRLVPAAPGTRVFAGTLNRAARLRVRVERAFEATRLAALLREVEAGARRRAPLVALADRLAGAFVAVVLGLALLTLLLWLPRGLGFAVDQAIALLIVTCPCALALATPLAVTVAIGRAARAGILVKSGHALEALARPGHLVLDKTGTVTEGRVALTRWDGPEEVKPLVVALERHVTHPLAAAILEAWPQVEAPVAAGVKVSIGGGIEGDVAGRRVVVGAPAFVRERAGDDAPRRPARVHGGEEAAGAPGETPVLVAVDGRIVARAWFADAIRADAPEALARLRARGWRTSLLSGDDPAVVAAVGARLGFDPRECQGGVTPEGKLAWIESVVAREPVAMVGDGVNDAAAIARATVGIGVHGGAEACLASADVFLARPGFSSLVALTEGARRTLGVIRRNLAFSVAYNVVGAGLAMAGLVNPLVAAVMMPLSSLTVVIASWKSRTFEVSS